MCDKTCFVTSRILEAKRNFPYFANHELEICDKRIQNRVQKHKKSKNVFPNYVRKYPLHCCGFLKRETHSNGAGQGCHSSRLVGNFNCWKTHFLRCERALVLLFSTPGMCGVRDSIVCKTIGTVVDFRQVGREKLEETEPIF